MAKELVGFFGTESDLPPEQQKRAIVDAVMKRFEEMGLFNNEKEEKEDDNAEK